MAKPSALLSGTRRPRRPRRLGFLRAQWAMLLAGEAAMVGCRQRASGGRRGASEAGAKGARHWEAVFAASSAVSRLYVQQRRSYAY